MINVNECAVELIQPSNGASRINRTYLHGFFLLLGLLLALPAQSQIVDSLPVFDYSQPKDYEIGGITITGATYSDENALKAIAGFRVGDQIRIPGGDIPRAMKALWNLRLFTDIQILQEKSIGDVIFLEIRVEERPRLTTHSYRGVKKTTHDDLNEEVNKHLVKGGIVTENVKVNAQKALENYFIGKGYLDAEVKVIEVEDSSRINAVRLIFDIDRKERIKIKDIVFTGNDNVKSKKLLRKFDETKTKKRLFGSSKFIRNDYRTDKELLVDYYNTIGFRDARILGDTIWRNEDGEVMIRIDLEEGNQYFFRTISWKGNSIYDEETLSTVLGIEPGDVYNQELLETRLRFSQDGRDVSTLYMDNGYLFFQVNPIEVAIDGDSIDLELRIFEGPQATIDKVIIKGNDRTHEHVIRRELRTRPGEKFSRSDIIRSQREIINLGYFNPEALGINTPVNPQRGTVDIEYTVEEKPSDQLELSAGWGGLGRGVIGTLGVSFNNFSVRNIFNKEAWNPLPQGDGQRLSLRAQTNGRFFQSYNASFTEPWLGGKKPNSFTVAGFYTQFTNGQDKESSSFGKFSISGVTLSLGTRLKWPDDNFISSTAVNIQNIALDNWGGNIFVTDDGQIVTGGNYNNFSITQTFTRSSINNPLFPQEGSKFSLAVQLTPPYSLFSNKDYSELAVEDRFKWLEYHKWRFTAEWYATLVGKLTLKAEAKIGMIDAYNKDIGISPFERFQLGGDGLNNQQFGQFNGTDIISMRGYEIADIEANVRDGSTVATPIFDKFTVEVRYPISLNPSSTIYVLAFAQGGNAWQSFKDFNPFDVKRSAGLGLRVFLPMFGMLGFDYGLGFDKEATGTGSVFSRFGDFNIILGFEPE
ncbi:MAG: outer membrane protein assembly factor BamA [Phaeodactylibacter sp.]|nr:outer membrane protein assembly factor BamA [Phaeodactylibacter sp.]